MNNLIPFRGSNTQSIDHITMEQVRRVFGPLGAQEYEIPEITEDLSNAIESLDKYYLQEHPDIASELLDNISELSDSSRRFHVPYELIVDALQDNPEVVKRVCNMGISESPRKILNQILSSAPFDEDEDEDEDDDLPFMAIAI